MVKPVIIKNRAMYFCILEPNAFINLPFVFRVEMTKQVECFLVKPKFKFLISLNSELPHHAGVFMGQ